jgi:hypothetical protein
MIKTLDDNIIEIKNMFGNSYANKSYFDLLSAEDVLKANREFTKIVYGEELVKLFEEKNVSQLRRIKQKIMDSNSTNFGPLKNENIGLILVRPEIVDYLESLCEFLEGNGLEIIYKKQIVVSLEQYLVLYEHTEIPNNIMVFLPTRTFNYINRPCELIVCTSSTEKTIDAINNIKGSSGLYTKNTIRGDFAYNLLIKSTTNKVKYIDSSNLMYDPIGVYRAIVRGEINGENLFYKKDNYLLHFSGQAIHSSQDDELEKDLSILCTNDDIKKIKKRLLKENY